MHARRGGLALRLMRQGHLFGRTERNEMRERDARVDVRGRTRVLPRGGSTLASTNARACVSRSEPSRVCGSGAEVAKRGTTSARFGRAEKKKRAVAAIFERFCREAEASNARSLLPVLCSPAKKKKSTVRVRNAGAKTDRRHRQCFARTRRARWRSTSRLPGA